MTKPLLSPLLRAHSFALLLVMGLGAGPQALASVQCQKLFHFSIEKTIDNTITALANLRIKIDMTTAEGSRSPMLVKLQADYINKENELITHVEQTQMMTAEQLKQKITEEILRSQGHIQADHKKTQEEKQKEKIQSQKDVLHLQDIVIDGSRMVFNRIEPGHIKMFAGGVEATIEKPFEMMATPVTQLLWRRVAEMVHAKSPGAYTVQANPSRFKGDLHPVEKISLLNTMNWITLLNYLSRENEPGLADIIPGFQAGDQFRLPTNEEWEFVVRGRGQFNDTYYFGKDATELEGHAWIESNSSGQTQPVAQKKPLVVDGRPFYDMYGNVWEFVREDMSYKSSSRSLARGGSWKFDTANSKVISEMSSAYDDAFGFRLVREVRP